MRQLPLSDELVSVAYGAVLGAYDGIVGTVKTVVHPVDNILYPIAELTYHSVVLLGHRALTDHEDPELRAAMKELLQQDDTILPATNAYFEKCGQQLENIKTHFKNANLQEKTRMIAEFATGYYLTGKIINRVSAVRTAFKNKQYFGTWHEAPTYTLLEEFGARNVTPPPIKLLTIEDLLTCTQEQSYLCIYTTVAGKPKLLLATEEQAVAHMTRYTKADGNPVFTPNHWISHRDLAYGTHPYFAGSVRTIGDKVIRNVMPDEIPAQFRQGPIANTIRLPGGISNASPYETAGPHIRGLMEKALKDFGLQNVEGKFKEYYPANRGYRAGNVTRPEFLSAEQPITPHQLAFAALTGRVTVPNTPTSEWSDQTYQRLLTGFSQSAQTTESLRATYTTGTPQPKTRSQSAHESRRQYAGFSAQMDAADRNAQAQRSMLDQTQLHLRLNVPLPSKPLSISSSDTTKMVCDKIDGYFEDIIRNYLPPTQTLLRKMYYEDKNVTYGFHPGSAGTCSIKESKNDDIFVTINSQVENRPIAVRMIKIHEIAVHAGQLHQRIAQVGFDTYSRERNQFYKFTEQSVSLSEKILLDALPDKILSQELGRLEWKYELYDDQDMSVDNYVHLQHRHDHDKLTPHDHELFLCNPRVKSFLTDGIRQFYPNDSGNTGSTETYRKLLEATIRSFPQPREPQYSASTTAYPPTQPTQPASEKTLKMSAKASTAAKPKETAPTTAYDEKLNQAAQALRSMSKPHYTTRATAVPPKPTASAAQKKRADEIRRTNAATAKKRAEQNANNPQSKNLGVNNMFNRKASPEETQQLREIIVARKAQKENPTEKNIKSFASHTASFMDSTSKNMATIPGMRGASRTVSKISNGISGMVSSVGIGSGVGSAVTALGGSAATATAAASAATGFGIIVSAGLMVASLFFGEEESQPAGLSLEQMENLLDIKLAKIENILNTHHEINITYHERTQHMLHIGFSQMHAEHEAIFQRIISLENSFRQESAIASAKLDFISTKDLNEARSTIRDYNLGVNSIPSTITLEKALSTVKMWLTQYLKLPIFNDTFYASMPDRAIPLLESNINDNAKMFGFIASLLNKHFPNFIPKEFLQLPSLPGFEDLMNDFLDALDKAQIEGRIESRDAYHDICAKLKSTLNLYLQFSKFLKDNPQLIQALFDKYHMNSSKEILMILKSIVHLIENEKFNAKLALIEKSNRQLITASFTGDMWDHLPNTLSESERVRKMFGFLSQGKVPALSGKYMILPKGMRYERLPEHICFHDGGVIRWGSSATGRDVLGISFGPTDVYSKTPPKPAAFYTTSLLLLCLSSGYADANFFRNSTLRQEAWKFISTFGGIHSYHPDSSKWQSKIYWPKCYRNSAYFTERNKLAEEPIFNGHVSNYHRIWWEADERLPQEYLSILNSTILEQDKLKIAFQYILKCLAGDLTGAQAFAKTVDPYCLLFLIPMISTSESPEGRPDIFETYIKSCPLVDDFDFAKTIVGWDRTPLMLAAEQGLIHVVTFLLSKMKRNDIAKLSSENKTAAQYAREQEFNNVATMIDQASRRVSQNAIVPVKAQTALEKSLTESITMIDDYQTGFKEAAKRRAEEQQAQQQAAAAEAIQRKNEEQKNTALGEGYETDEKDYGGQCAIFKDVTEKFCRTKKLSTASFWRRPTDIPKLNHPGCRIDTLPVQSDRASLFNALQEQGVSVEKKRVNNEDRLVVNLPTIEVI